MNAKVVPKELDTDSCRDRRLLLVGVWVGKSEVINRKR